MTFLFDIGRVLLDFDFTPSLARLMPPGTPGASDKLATLMARKDELESGGVHIDEYTRWALEVLGTGTTAEEFHHAWRQIFTPNEPMWAKVRELAAAGHRLILFSNTNGIHSPWIFENYPEFALFHGAVLSHEAGAIKPQPQIYQYAIHHFDLVPQETRYIDDLPENIEAGIQTGFRSWQYDLHDHASFERWLAAELSR
jgi:glucose-1-phosphatase